MNEYEKMIKNCVFKSVKTKYIENGELIERRAIALCDKESGLIIKQTDYADYILYRRHQDMDYAAKNDNGIYAAVQFLNYVLIDNYSVYRIKDIKEVTIDMVYDFLKAYSKRKTNRGEYPRKSTVKEKRNQISDFLYNMCYYFPEEMKNIKQEDIMDRITQRNIDGEKRIINDYKVKVKYGSRNRTKLYRDMPLEIVERFVKMAEIYDPEMVFAIILMAYGGLRGGEVCSLRLPYDSCYGPGIIISTTRNEIVLGGKYHMIEKCQAFEVDLTHEYLMRSDGIGTGFIKRERPQSFYTKFNDIIFHYYKKHLELMKDKPIEMYGPMFVNKTKNKKTGKYMALNKKELSKRIVNLFYDHVVPSLEHDSNVKFQLFYKQIQNGTWGIHSFRHWFTVYLVLLGCDAVTIQTLRGDSNVNSAQAYLRRKGELHMLYKEAVDEIARRITGDIINVDNENNNSERTDD